MKPVYILLFLFVLAGCCKTETIEVSGKKPVYISYNDLLIFEQQPPQPIINAGKAVLYNDYLFLGEVNKGIHVIDVSDTLNPQKISFLKIPGNKDMAIQNSRLYADNGPHLLILNIDSITHITLVERKNDIFHPSEYFPPNYEGDFECVDYSKGWLLEWQDAKIENPQCNR